MILWHLTDEAGREGIQARGFQQPAPPEGPPWNSPERGVVWFAASKQVAKQTCWRSGWWVRIEVPDDTPEHQLEPGFPHTGNYALDIDYVNGLDLAFEPETDV